MSEFIVQFKSFRQISPDDWENYTPTLKITEETRIREVYDWYKKQVTNDKMELKLIEL